MKGDNNAIGSTASTGRGIARESSDAQHLALNGHMDGYGCAVLDTGRGSPDLNIKERLPVR